MKKLLCLLIIPVLLISCNKKYHVIGRVYNPVTGEGLANVKVEFFKSNVGLSTGYSEVASTLTDGNGNYDLEYKGKAENVKLELDASLYQLGNYYEGNYQTVRGLEPKKTQQIDWHAVPYGKLKLNIHNNSCENPQDKIVIDRKYRHDPNNSIYTPITLLGCHNEDGTPSSNIPMGYYDITWTVTKTSTGTNTFTGQVFVPAGGVGEITINY